MAILGIDFRNGAASVGPDALERAASARAGAGGGPTVVMIHGYKYDPADPRRSPHRLLFSDRPDTCRHGVRRIRSWPAGLGVTASGRDGLCVGYGWRARAPWVPSLLRGRNGFSAAYAEAGRAGEGLAPLLGALARARPEPVDLIAHSLAARVALSALRAAARGGGGPT
jgi:hypothetical protein